MDEDRVELNRAEARAGSSTHVTRYVLPISLALIVVVFAVVLFWWR